MADGDHPLSSDDDDEFDEEFDLSRSLSSQKSDSRSYSYRLVDDDDEDSGLSVPNHSPPPLSQRNGVARRGKTATKTVDTSNTSNTSHDRSRSSEERSRIHSLPLERSALHPGEEPRRRSLGTKGVTPFSATQPEKPASTNDRGWLLKPVIVIALVVFLVALVSENWQQPKQPVTLKSSPQGRMDLSKEHLIAEFKKLKGMFANQPVQRKSPHPWQTVLNSIAMMNTTGEKQPAIVLWVPLEGAATTLDCLVNHTFRALYDVSRHVINRWIISSDSFLSGDTSRDKKALDTRLEAILSDEAVAIPVALVRHIDRLDANMALLFHKYCDHEASLRPKSIIMLTLDGEIATADQSHIYDLLRSKWIKDKIHRGQVDAILSRILTWPVYVQKEEDSVLAKHCP